MPVSQLLSDFKDNIFDPDSAVQRQIRETDEDYRGGLGRSADTFKASIETWDLNVFIVG